MAVKRSLSLEFLQQFYDNAIKMEVELPSSPPSPTPSHNSSESRSSQGSEDFINFITSVQGNALPVDSDRFPVAVPCPGLSQGPSVTSVAQLPNIPQVNIPNDPACCSKRHASSYTVASSSVTFSPCDTTDSACKTQSALASPCSNVKSPSSSGSIISPASSSSAHSASTPATSGGLLEASDDGMASHSANLCPVLSSPASVLFADSLPNPSSVVESPSVSQTDEDELSSPAKRKPHPRPSTSAVTSSSNPPLLPPCRVCGEKASGFHYGANTCEACKGFFRRSLARKVQYRCAANENCEVGEGQRSVCAFCRFKKCLSLGMSKNAIKTGRYTHEKKTRDIEEVERLQGKDKEAVNSEVHPLSNVPPKPVEESPFTPREQMLEKIIKDITLAHLSQTPHQPDFFEKLPQREAEYLEKRALKEEMFGSMKPISRDEYKKIYQSTGIDIDGRREMISNIIPCLEKAIKRFIVFAKSLPGFKELPLEDQIALIKVQRCDVWLIASHPVWNVKERLYTGKYGYTIGFPELSMYNNVEYLENLFEVLPVIQSMNLSSEEIALMIGICLFSSELVDSGLQNPARIGRCQDLIAEALYYWVKRTRPLQPFFFLAIVRLFTLIRSIKFERNNLKKFTEFSHIPVPQLLVDMWMN